MTPDPSSSLVERVAAAMFGAHPRICAWDEADQGYREIVMDEARAAIRVVVEAAKREVMQDVRAWKPDTTTGMTLRALARRIAALAPTDTP